MKSEAADEQVSAEAVRRADQALTEFQEHGAVRTFEISCWPGEDLQVKAVQGELLTSDHRMMLRRTLNERLSDLGRSVPLSIELRPDNDPGPVRPTEDVSRAEHKLTLHTR